MSAECECGNRRDRRQEACRRCQYLDGRTALVMHAIMVLRGTDGLTISEICEAVYGRADENARHSMRRIVVNLTSTGRLRKYWDETLTRSLFGSDESSAAYGAYRYALWGETR